MTSTTSRLRRRGAGALITLVMLAAACSSDDSSGGATTAPASESTAAETTQAADTTAPPDTTPTTETFAPPTGEPIKFGTTTWTLPQVSLTIRNPGIAAAVDYINAHGGINGRPLEWVYCPAADANAGEACARQMVDEGVVATVGDGDLIAEQLHSKVLADAGIPQIEPFVGYAETMSNPNVFMLCQGTPLEYAAIPAYMKEVGKTKLHFLAGEFSSAEGNMQAVTKAAEYYGIEVTGKTGVPMTSPDFLAQMQEATNANADVNVTIIAPFQSALMIQAAQQLSVDPKFGLSEGQFNASQYAEFGTSGGPLESALLTACVPPFSAADEIPAVQTAADAIAAYYEKSGDELAAPDKTSAMTLYTWFAMMAFADIARQQSDVTAASITAGFESTDGIDLGLAHPWVPSNPGPEGFSRVSNPWVYLVAVKDGKSVLYQDEPIDSSLPWQQG